MKMPQKTKGSQELVKLRNEVSALRSFVIGIAGRDPEGAYRPELAARILAARQDEPIYTFKNAKQFLALLSETE